MLGRTIALALLVSAVCGSALVASATHSDPLAGAGSASLRTKTILHSASADTGVPSQSARTSTRGNYSHSWPYAMLLADTSADAGDLIPDDEIFVLSKTPKQLSEDVFRVLSRLGSARSQSSSLLSDEIYVLPGLGEWSLRDHPLASAE